jgi:hypothetical protein
MGAWRLWQARPELRGRVDATGAVLIAHREHRWRHAHRKYSKSAGSIPHLYSCQQQGSGSVRHRGAGGQFEKWLYGK